MLYIERLDDIKRDAWRRDTGAEDVEPLDVLRSNCAEDADQYHRIIGLSGSRVNTCFGIRERQDQPVARRLRGYWRPKITKTFKRVFEIHNSSRPLREIAGMIVCAIELDDRGRLVRRNPKI